MRCQYNDVFFSRSALRWLGQRKIQVSIGIILRELVQAQHFKCLKTLRELAFLIPIDKTGNQILFFIYFFIYFLLFIHSFCLKTAPLSFKKKGGAG